MIALEKTVRTLPEIERHLRLGVVQQTDNREALVELGFTPAYPQLAHDEYYGTIWTRAIEAYDRSTAARRTEFKALVIERIFLVPRAPAEEQSDLDRQLLVVAQS